jgi:hypothetical protein
MNNLRHGFVFFDEPAQTGRVILATTANFIVPILATLQPDE